MLPQHQWKMKILFLYIFLNKGFNQLSFHLAAALWQPDGYIGNMLYCGGLSIGSIQASKGTQEVATNRPLKHGIWMQPADMRSDAGSTDRHKATIFTLDPLHVKVGNTGTLSVACYGRHWRDVTNKTILCTCANVWTLSDQKAVLKFGFVSINIVSVFKLFRS